MNYYELLGINKNSTEEEIKRAYKMQMKKWHPDINKSSDAILMSTKINEAKEILLDTKKRKDYDEYLAKKVDVNYNKYTKNKKNNKTNTYDGSNKMVTKWEYLKQWIKFSNYKPIRKILGIIGVFLESFMCLIIKILLIILAYIFNIGSYIIISIFNYLSPLIIFVFILLIVQFVGNDFKEVFETNINTIKILLICILIYISSLFMPHLSNLVLSPKTFDILYNKIDINLFKKCVGYK